MHERPKKADQMSVCTRPELLKEIFRYSIWFSQQFINHGLLNQTKEVCAICGGN